VLVGNVEIRGRGHRTSAVRPHSIPRSSSTIRPSRRDLAKTFFKGEPDSTLVGHVDRTLPDRFDAEPFAALASDYVERSDPEPRNTRSGDIAPHNACFA